MTALARAARNYLAQQPEVAALLGSDEVWDSWIFVGTPEVNIESTSKAMVVLFVDGGWAGANSYNTARFPRIVVDIWVDPTRSDDGSVFRKDAEERAEEIYKAIDRHLHLVHNSLPGGEFIYWGTREQIEEKTGERIVGSTRSGEPDYAPAFDNLGATIARVNYNVSV